jgi:hypothetical protein
MGFSRGAGVVDYYLRFEISKLEAQGAVGTRGFRISNFKFERQGVARKGAESRRREEQGAANGY